MSDYLRTEESAAKYREYRASGAIDIECPLCVGEAIATFTHWKVMKNRFPYDRVAARHDMLLPLRHATDAGLTSEEIAELKVIKASYVQDYDYILEATVKTKSVPQHFHLHLIVGKNVV